MADVRINALATTATTSASDDYLAIDGSANGTRKLSAYSPTFGGNLTVSGTGTSSVAGNLTVKSASAYTNFTVGESSNTYSVFFYASGQSNGVAFGTNGSNVPLINGFNNTFTTAQNLALQSNGGNVLVGTSTDSSNGKLQLATHTTSAGGVGFGTETSLYRVGAGQLAIDYIGGTLPLLTFRENGVEKLRMYSQSGVGNIETQTAASLNLRTNGTTALTLDSSQNATFAGTVVAVGNSTFKRSDNTGSIRFIPTSGVSAGSDIESFNGSTSAYNRLNTRGTHLQVYTGTSGNTLALTVDDSQRTILGGALRLNNAYTASVVVPTGYVTIQDSTGTTYKVCVLL